MNIVIFGPPGAGKGTQSNFIVNKFNLHQLSTGDLLRKEIKDQTKLGSEISSIINSGNLVSDQIVSDLIEKYISNSIYKSRLIFENISAFFIMNYTPCRNISTITILILCVSFTCLVPSGPNTSVLSCTCLHLIPRN